ncbi:MULTISPECIES: hypothetical protein [unclassified Dokdonia]|uniref:hypothetical protein n=1 Tax=unclassified Dokdonia TaxID=2615033 RepID=UPI000068AC67|nr:hypothetical protein [Dokdonia sp. MED134]EAQ40460.1 hypothetical protein MED134_06884 [Dokdonia sp. MED134]
MPSKRIEETLRCQLFQGIAAEVWDDIVYHHNVSVNKPEIGVTAKIIADIRNFRTAYEQNFDVYARAAKDEATYGGDIDIFLETTPGCYKWFALQAKVLFKDNKYQTLRYNGKPRQQWEKLRILEKMTSCKGYYLLFNGKFRNATSPIYTDSCDRPFRENQFGCSLVDLDDVEAVANRKNIRGQFIKATYESFHPDLAEPWRVLTCCYHNDVADENCFTIQEIEEDCRNYYPLKDNFIDTLKTEKGHNDFNEEENNDNKEPDDFVGLNMNNRISVARREAQWNPSFRIIIKHTVQE